MKTEYRRDMQHSYLVVEPEKQIEEESFEIRMIQENEITGLLNCSYRRIDNKLLCYYDITSKMTLIQRCQIRKISGEELLRLMNCILHTMENLEEYLLDVSQICLVPNYIFVNVDMKEISFCYLPGEGQELQEGLRNLMDLVLPVLDHSNPQSVMIGYSLHQYLMQSQFSIEEFKQQLKSEEYREKREPAKPVTEISVEAQRLHEELLDSFFEEEEPEEDMRVSKVTVLGAGIILCYLCIGWYLWRNAIGLLWIWILVGVLCGVVVGGFYFWRIRGNGNQQRLQSFENKFVKKEMGQEIEGETELEVDWKEECFTTILSRRQKTSFYLEELYPEPGKRIPLGEKEILFLGQLKDTVDVILPSEAVSRIHAKLRRVENEIYLSDLNSRNGTWVNKKELEGEEILLQEGDEIKFADLVFRFYSMD